MPSANVYFKVSTDFDEADELYFENISLETVCDIYTLENATGVLGAMGGQTPNNIALPLYRAGINVLGTSPEMIDTAENRYKFSRMLDTIGVDQPAWKENSSLEDAKKFCNDITYPVLVRPSYVLSGAAMNTVYSEQDLENYLEQAVSVSREYPVVITKYIEGAKEIEMDAVAKDGVVVGHFISEHVENAGVHSGDATLILPPQDLEPETIARIEEATRKIGAALNVTGPFNIQFIAKDNDIKVIECNVRASRSFPFVSKVMGVDLIEMATKAIMGKPFTEYPPTTIANNCVGVKVPQFSFSRLSGADPVTGVEMASTGEVACFGADKYEAYLKALMSTGFKIPKQNILLSIGSYKDKKEMLPSVEKLQKLGYKLFATAGTADFLQEHNIPVQYLEVLAEEQESQRSEFSLTQHLAKNTIDLYINLPSNNKYRRPANYMSKGYQTRRMAVDYQIPLVTNVKNAKILVEAIARHFNLEVGNRDFQTSHRTLSLPGLINVAAFVPGIATAGTKDLQAVTKASLMAGFGMVRIMPVGVDGSVTDAISLKVAQQHSKEGGYCDYNFSVSATSDNADQISQVTGEVGSLFIPFNHLSGNISKVAAVTAHFDSWPTHKPIVTDAKLTDLASILLLASLHNRRIHVTSISNKDDIRLIALSKEKGLKVTCDVSVFSLYLSQADYPGCSLLPTAADQAALWQHLSVIDVFSIGSLPYQLASSLGQTAEAAVGIADVLPLLLTSVTEGRLTVEDIKARLYDNPKEIFELHEQVSTGIEVEVDRAYRVPKTASWSPFAGRVMRGSVQRVTFQGKTVCLDGELLPGHPLGTDMSTHGAMPMSPALKPTTVSLGQALETPRDRRSSLLGSRPAKLRPAAESALQNRGHGGGFDDLSSPMQLQPALGSQLQDLLAQPSSWKHQSVLSVTQYTRSDLHHLFTVAQAMRRGVQREGVLNVLRGRLLCTLFYEPSTRTSASFDAAMQRLGGRTVAISTSHSSVQKGETLQDTLRTLGCYGDAVVLRHPDERSVDVARRFAQVPVINGGNGSKEHPTQAFLDLFTIREELGTVQNLTITFIGDLLYGRPVHSLIYLLRDYGVRVNLVSPKTLQLPSDIRQFLEASGQLGVESETLTDDILAHSDVLYCTRVQKERFPSAEEYENVKNSYRIDNRTLRAAKKDMCILHPLPRNEEIAQEVDTDPRAAYFRQVSLPPVPEWRTYQADMLLDEVRPVLPHGSVGVGHGALRGMHGLGGFANLHERIRRKTAPKGYAEIGSGKKV
jgi:carbamoyl-phosphate synthase/aspartate carbamoyltransferase